jgi:hypothetical protein
MPNRGRSKDPLVKAGYKKAKLHSGEAEAERRGIVGYRIVKPRPGVAIRVALTKKKGPRGGRTVAVTKLKK